MAAIFCENCSVRYFQSGRIFQLAEASEGLLFIMLGKVLLSIYLLRVRKQTVRQSFMGYFCISLAFLDIMLLVTMSFFSYFQNFMILGIQFTTYHTCLLAQITALTYGNLHFPVFFVTCLDYCITISWTAKSSTICCRSLYSAAVVFMWITVFCYVLMLPGTSIGLGVSHYNAADQCIFYISSQSYWLSLCILFLICLILVFCWSDVMKIVHSIKLITLERETVIFFPYVLECSPRDCAKHLLARLLICFMGTWAPFVFLQLLLVSLGAQIPAYIEMNIPWLYFVNSFLIAFAYWVRRRHVQLTEEHWDMDPLVSWKFCFVPFVRKDVDEDQKPTAEITIC